MSGPGSLRIGDPAPAFTLRDQHGSPVSLAELTGERSAVLVFFPYAFSRVCTGELQELRDQRKRFDDAGASLVGISCDPMFSLRAYADTDGIDFPLLSDFWPHGEVASAYGVFDSQLGCATRSTFVVDAGGQVRWVVHNPMGEPRDIDAYLREVEAGQTS